MLQKLLKGLLLYDESTMSGIGQTKQLLGGNGIFDGSSRHKRRIRLHCNTQKHKGKRKI